MFTRRNGGGVCAAILLAVAASSASAANYTLNWLDMSPTPVGSSVPNNSNFNLPGVGVVNVTYSLPGPFSDARTVNPLLTNGNVTFGPDTYSWGNQELFGATLLSGPDPLVPVQWRITYTFPGTMPAGSIYLGVAGLGQTSSFGGGKTTATVNQNGTFFGDWSGGGNYGPTLYTPGAGTFSMENTLTGAGGADPWWNTPLAVVRIDDAINSLTVDFSHIRGDGAGVNIAAIVPEPATMALLALGGLFAVHRRRAV